MYEIKEGTSHTLAECGIFTALAMVLVLISAYIPLIGSLTMLVWAAPLIALVMRRGVGAGVLSAVVVVVLSIFLTGPVWGILAGLSVGLFGIIYGHCFQKAISPAKTLFIGTIAAGLLTFVSLALATVVGSLSLQDIFGGMEETFREVFAMYEEMGVLGQMLPQGVSSAEYINDMVEIFYRLLPGVFIVISMAMAACNYIFSSLLLRKLTFEIKPLPIFREWHFPWWILWGVALILLGYLMGNQFNNDNYFTLSLNLVYVYLPIFLISGISVVAFFFHHWNLKRGTQVLIWVFSIFLLRFTIPFLMLMGAVDTLLDYRKLLKKVNGQKTDRS